MAIRFNSKAKRYINDKGQFISETFVIDSLNSHRQGVQMSVQAIFDANPLDPDTPVGSREAATQELLQKISSEIRYLTTIEYVTGKGGINNLTPTDIAYINDQILKKELTTTWGADGRSYGLEEVLTAYENGEISYAQMRARVSAYVRGTRKAYWQAKDSINNIQDLPYMSRKLNGIDHCDECIQYQRAGMVPVGSLPLPGQLCSCGSNCNCTVTYHSQRQYKAWVKQQLNNFSESALSA